jgi:aryl-alcohol dehydrogenase-like predicted oxidoreductase
MGYEPAHPMATLTLAGAAVPRVILGTSNVGSVVPDALVPGASRERELRYLDSMLAVGCSAFDIAASYQLGGTERVIGEWMHARHNRGQLFLITKGGHPYPVVQPNRVTPKALADDLHDSLRRLRTEYVDLYLLHRDHPGAPLEPILETLDGFRRSGKVKAWGVSNWTHARIQALDALARASGLPSVAASSPHFSLVDWTSVPWKGCVSIAGDGGRDARAFHGETQLPVLAWSPLGRGFFSRPAPEAAKDGAGVYGSPANVARRERAETLARKYEVSAAQIALAYLFSQPFPVFAIVAASTAEKMRGNLAVSALRLRKSEVGWLESGGEPLSERDG